MFGNSIVATTALDKPATDALFMPDGAEDPEFGSITGFNLQRDLCSIVEDCRIHKSLEILGDTHR